MFTHQIFRNVSSGGVERADRVPIKLLAKICSDLNKPDALTILDFKDIPDRIWPLPVGKINGIGPKANQKLLALGINTIGGLAQAAPGFLQANFGRSYGRWLHEVSHGIDNRPVITDAKPKSLSRETTFERDLHPRYDRQILSEVFTSLCAGVAQDLQRKGYVGRTISIKLRYADFRTITRDITLPVPIADAVAVRRAAEECLRRVPLERRLRLLGVRASSLLSARVSESNSVPRQEELPLVSEPSDLSP